MMLTEKVETILARQAKKSKTLQFAMRLPGPGIEYSYSSTGRDQRFHSASVGKLATATLAFMAIERGKLALDSPVGTILESGILDGLFVPGGADRQAEVTVRHLLGHTSGVNDYFESKAFDGSSFIDGVLRNPGTLWKPLDLLDYTRTRQKAVAAPGEKFFYSDTGYVLLGLVVEAAFGMPFHRALETFIFGPAGMKDTTLCYHSEGFDPRDLAPLYLGGVDVHLHRSVSCDFSGGGLSTTTADLLGFLDALQGSRLVSQASLNLMAGFANRYRQGLHYGLGMMQTRFEEFFFLLRGMPRLRGHLGVTGVHAWYDPASKASYVLNVGNTKDIAVSFQLLIRILQLVMREERVGRSR